MSCYMIESDKLFLCCEDIQVMKVYEIDSLYIAPLLQKHWTLVNTINLGEGLESEALQIGDPDVIRSADLERLMQDLRSLGMMVNREGLCFNKTSESNVSDECQVEYYRMFDLFDWSNYFVKSRLNTKWVRNDIVTGRPIFEIMLGAKDTDLIEIKRLHSGELLALKRMRSQDIEELKQKHLEDLVELKRMHSQNIEELKQMHLEELVELKLKHSQDMEELKPKHLADLAEFELRKENESYECMNELFRE